MRFTRTETCKYIADQTAELAKLAIAADLETVRYLLEMTQLEANNQVIAELKPCRVDRPTRDNKLSEEMLVASAP
jgi:hypothetical protein